MLKKVILMALFFLTTTATVCQNNDKMWLEATYDYSEEGQLPAFSFKACPSNDGNLCKHLGPQLFYSLEEITYENTKIGWSASVLTYVGYALAFFALPLTLETMNQPMKGYKNNPHYLTQQRVKFWQSILSNIALCGISSFIGLKTAWYLGYNNYGIAANQHVSGINYPIENVLKLAEAKSSQEQSFGAWVSAADIELLDRRLHQIIMCRKNNTCVGIYLYGYRYGAELK